MGAYIEKIELRSRLSTEIVLQWSNDRYQAIELKTKNAEGLIDALERLVYELRVEHHNNHI